MSEGVRVRACESERQGQVFKVGLRVQSELGVSGEGSTLLMVQQTRLPLRHKRIRPLPLAQPSIYQRQIQGLQS